MKAEDFLNLLDDIEDNVQEMRESGDTDLRRVLYLLEKAREQVERQEG